ncbi:DUF11 domain-containing protein [Candidatus Saccharibacteria bacterium]|jgi:uncharacterized repeat protein (TIGR01451 family)|nr:DUF11 domain-containing protein [Candidatus Saccharibacteria bacterium]
MKKLLAALKRAPRRVAGLAVVLAAIAVPAGLLAWGPERPTYTLEQPADHVTFNSITNNAKHGDERNFVQIREAGVGNYGEEVELQPGKEYEVYVFFHNNAKNKYNSAEYGHRGIAQNAQMRVQMPSSVKKGEKARVTGFISADNAQPKMVWDEAYGVGSADMALRYVPNSAKITSLGAVNGQTMPDSLYTTGAPLGYDSLDGKLPGCNEFSGYVIFRFKAVQPNFEIIKEVSKSKQNSYAKSVNVNTGDTVDYKIQYKNTGQVRQDNVVIKDVLPKGVSYIPGSTYVATSKTNGQWENITDDGIVSKGINIGSYSPGGNAYVKFSAKVDKLNELDCGQNKLTNVAYAETDNGKKQDEADVIVDKECQEEPVYTCDALGINKIADNRYKFETGYTVKGGTFKSVTYIVRDANNNEVARINGAPNAAEYTQSTPGKYTVEAVVTFTVNGQEVVADSAKCKGSFEVAEQPGEIKVCRLEDKQIINIKESDFDSNKHSMNLADCDEVLVTPTPTTPVAPTELPQTGGISILSTLGMGAITVGIAYYLTGRRLLN